MSFNALSKGIASTLAGVFGDPYQFERIGHFRYEGVPVIVRRNAEGVDGNGQVVMIEHLVRIAKGDAPVQPKRGDILRSEDAQYELGRLITETEGVWEFEASRC